MKTFIQKLLVVSVIVSSLNVNAQSTSQVQKSKASQDKIGGGDTGGGNIGVNFEGNLPLNSDIVKDALNRSMGKLPAFVSAMPIHILQLIWLYTQTSDGLGDVEAQKFIQQLKKLLLLFTEKKKEKLISILPFIQIKTQDAPCADKERNLKTASVWNQPSMTICFSIESVLQNEKVNYQNIQGEIMGLLLHEIGHIFSDYSEEELLKLQEIAVTLANSKRGTRMNVIGIFEMYSLIQIEWMHALLKNLEDFKKDFSQDPVGNCLELGQIRADMNALLIRIEKEANEEASSSLGFEGYKYLLTSRSLLSTMQSYCWSKPKKTDNEMAKHILKVIMGLEDRSEHFNLMEMFDLPKRKDEYVLPFDVKTLRQPYLRTDVADKKLAQVIEYVRIAVRIAEQNFAIYKHMLKQHDPSALEYLIEMEGRAGK